MDLIVQISIGESGIYFSFLATALEKGTVEGKCKFKKAPSRVLIIFIIFKIRTPENWKYFYVNAKLRILESVLTLERRLAS